MLGRFVREKKWLTLEDAVRKMTSMPAARLKLADRGAIKPGMWADLVLFDPAAVGISGLERRHDLPGGGARMVRTPVGLHGVWVNGLQVFDGVKHSPPREGGPGRVLRIFDS